MRYLFILFIVEDLMGRFDTVHDRHLDIHKEQVIVICFTLFKGFETVVCKINSDTVLFKDTFDQFLVDDIIFRHKDLRIELRSMQRDGLLFKFRCLCRGSLKCIFHFGQSDRFEDDIVRIDTDLFDLASAGDIGNDNQFGFVDIGDCIDDILLRFVDIDPVASADIIVIELFEITDRFKMFYGWTEILEVGFKIVVKFCRDLLLIFSDRHVGIGIHIARLGRCYLFERQAEIECRTVILGTFEFEFAAHEFHKLTGDCQTETCTSIFSCNRDICLRKGFKDARLLIFGHTDTVILYREVYFRIEISLFLYFFDL